MTVITVVPRLVKVLEIMYLPLENRNIKRVIGKRIHIGKHYIAEHSKTPGLNAGDRFIIIEKYSTQNR
jgi:hypothetical protein